MTAGHRVVNRSAPEHGDGRRRAAAGRLGEPVDAVARPLVDRPHDRAVTALPYGRAVTALPYDRVLTALPQVAASPSPEPAVVAALDPVGIESHEQSMTAAAGSVGA